MRALRLLALLVAVSAGVSGCSWGSGTSAATGGLSSSTSRAPGGTDACAEVRLGIDAFNQGDFSGTVDHFTRAVPLARAQVSAHDTKAAEQLLAAVTYYAHLAPQDYPRASLSSPEFAQYKQITLGQCEADQPLRTASPSPSGLPA